MKNMLFGGNKKQQQQQQDKNDMVAQDRRRLSVGQVDAQEKATADEDYKKKQAGGNAGNNTAQNNKNLMKFLKDTGTLGCQQGQAARRGSFAVGSYTSEQQDSYDDKNVVTEGDEVVNHETLKNLGVGIRCKKGFKPEAPNQDSFTFIHYDKDFDLYGVFDGHGVNGHDVSNFVREFLPKLFISDQNRTNGNIKKAFEDSFKKMQLMLESSTQVDCRTSGTTCTMVYRVSGQPEIHVAYCGDSRAAIIYETPGGSSGGAAKGANNANKSKGLELTTDHKPNLPKEKERIERSGGCVIFDGFYNHRVFKRGTVYPGLNMSRALGDVIGHKEAGIIETPDYQCISLTAKDATRDNLVFMLCSDGVWEFIDVNEAARIVCRCRSKEDGRIDPHAAAEELAKESWNRWMEDTGGEISDDITVVMQVLPAATTSG